MKKYSIGSWAYLFNQEQPTNDFHTLVHKLGHLGYAGVELLGHEPHPTPDSHDTKEKRQNLRKMVVDHRLEFSGYAPLMWTEKLWSIEDHRPFVALFEKNAIFAEDLGIKTMRIDTVEPIASAAGFDPKLLFDRVVKAFDACSRIAANHGLTIAWEFEPGIRAHAARCDCRRHRRGSVPWQWQLRRPLRYLERARQHRGQSARFAAPAQREDHASSPERFRRHDQREQCSHSRPARPGQA